METKIWTEQDVINLQKLQLMLEVDSLNKVVISDGDEVGELGNLIQDNSPGPDELLEFIDRARIINEYVNKLKPRESIVIKMRYGLNDGNYKTLEEVGEHFGVSRERIRQIEQKAIRKLRWLLTVKGKYRNINDI